MRILIAEDDPYSLQILEMMLAKEKAWQVVSAKDGLEAWNLLQVAEPFDVGIFDIMMPGLDGLQLTTRLRADPRLAGLRVIFCTALNDRGTVQQAAGLGVSHYITKPYQRENIFKQLRRIAAERVTVCRIEPLSTMAERLGIDEEVIGAMLGGLQKEMEEFLAPLVGQVARPDAPEFSLRANALKGAAANLGASQMASRLAALESAPSPAWKPAVAQVVAENEHLKSFLATITPAATPA